VSLKAEADFISPLPERRRSGTRNWKLATKLEKQRRRRPAV
jgi:hypothetical protein